jgi:hypothetical protein
MSWIISIGWREIRDLLTGKKLAGKNSFDR